MSKREKELQEKIIRLEAENVRQRSRIFDLEQQLARQSPAWFTEKMKSLESSYDGQIKPLQLKVAEKVLKLRKIREFAVTIKDLITE